MPTIERALQIAAAAHAGLADNTETMDLTRLPDSSEQDLARLAECQAVRALLLAAPAL